MKQKTRIPFLPLGISLCLVAIAAIAFTYFDDNVGMVIAIISLILAVVISCSYAVITSKHHFHRDIVLLRKWIAYVTTAFSKPFRINRAGEDEMMEAVLHPDSAIKK